MLHLVEVAACEVYLRLMLRHRSPRSMRASLACSGVLLVLFGSRAARANDEATAEALFEQGRDAMRSGAYTKACLMFEESYRLVHGDGTKFNLGECYEKVGRTASAWAAFRDVAATSKLAGQKEREALAKARLEKSL